MWKGYLDKYLLVDIGYYWISKYLKNVEEEEFDERC